MDDDGNGEDPEELADGVLRESDADELAESLHTGTVGGVGVGPDGDG